MTTVEDERFRYTSAPERREKLVQYIADQGYCTIGALSEALGVSEMTIRRDVLRLVEQRRVCGFRGGVGAVSRQDIVGSDYAYRDLKMGPAKRAIARAAIELVGPASVIALDAGTTTNQVARMMPTDRKLQVVTHSLPAVSSMVGNAGAEIVCLGGILHKESLSFAGPATLAAIDGLQIEILFLAASGISDRGAFCGNGFDAITKRVLIDVAENVVLLADSSKFDIAAMLRICDWDTIDTIVIDDGVTADQVRMFEQHGVQVMAVAVREDAAVVS
ncbi:MAG TPA: DeoR/GlpR family DNA-binding transcription regulator [Cellulomonadaceae bacterium]|nr:DeoR/GlpR family DNA-binding transcription regulator [Cellulomonadaceae bacterium]